MQTMHIENMKKLTDKIPADEIKKILLIDHNKPSALSAALTQEGYDVVHWTLLKRPGV